MLSIKQEVILICIPELTIPAHCSFKKREFRLRYEKREKFKNMRHHIISTAKDIRPILPILKKDPYENSARYFYH